MDTLNDEPHSTNFITRSILFSDFFSLIKQRIESDSLDKQDPCCTSSCFGANDVESAHRSIYRPYLIGWIGKFTAILFLVLLIWPSATVFAVQVTLQWDPVSDADLAEYRIYVRSDGDDYGSEPAWVGRATVSTINNLVENNSYCFIVRASNTNGVESGNSNEACYQSAAEASNEPDTDGDGMPDAWETEMGLDPTKDDSQEDMDGDAISNIDEYEHGSDPGVPADNAAPLPPACKWPKEGEMVETMVPELATDEFADSDTGSGHFRSQWRIVRQFDQLCVLNVRSKFFLTKFIVPNWILESETEYSWQVRFFDEHGAASEWSTENIFETPIDMGDRDGNGIPDSQEVAQQQDVNGDGVADAMQPDTIKCVTENNTNGVLAVGISEPQGNILLSGMSNGDPQQHIRALSEPEVVPYGLIEYRIEVAEPGSTVQVKIYLPYPADEDAGWYQLGVENDWDNYSGYAQFDSNRKTITLELKDGGYGDIDGIENGVIVDRSGLVLMPQSSGGNTLPSSLEWEGSGACFIKATRSSNGVERFYLWLAAVGIAMIILSKLAAKLHDRFPRIK